MTSLVPYSRGFPGRRPGTCPRPVKSQAAQQEVSSGQASEASRAAPHRSHYCRNQTPTPHGKMSSTKLVPGAKKVGDLCLYAHFPYADTEVQKGMQAAQVHGISKWKNLSTHLLLPNFILSPSSLPAEPAPLKAEAR